ncbi:MAG: NADH-quinone oxidoreductase subunit M [Thermomicrobiaceae bacterium]|nr:NADH-quinone oxidoreductase subunit M [Thermomicrobiaceae bacterium]
MNGIPILSLMTYAPLVGALVIFFWPRASARAARWVALISSLVAFALSLVMLFGYDRSRPGMQFTELFHWLPGVGIDYHMGVDGISVPLIVLTTLLTVLSIIASWEPIQTRVREYMIAFLLLETGMLGVFVSLDLFLFYIFWEVMLIPMALLIGVWGSANRVYAAVKFFLYTLAGSLLMLVGIVATYQQYFQATGIRTLNVLELAKGAQAGYYSHDFQMWAFAVFFIAFAIKVPLWPFHTWLPDAHVEAPTAGSVILAGVLLKMGGYGLLRFNLPLYPDATRTWAPWIIVLSVIAIIYGAFVALVQPDLKKLVAYSSVSHMGFVTLGIFALNHQGLYGAMIVMLSHGFVTSALFLLVGMIYNRGHTRLISAFGGLATNMPVYGAFFGVFMLASLGLPGLSGFVGEFLSTLGAFRVYWVAGVIAMAVVIFAAWYMMWMFQRVVWMRAPGEPPDRGDQEAKLAAGGAAPHPVTGGAHDVGEITDHGEHFVPPQTFRDIGWTEIITVAPLALLTIWVGVYPQWVMSIMRPAIDQLLSIYR